MQKFTSRLRQSCCLLNSCPDTFQFAEWPISQNEVFYLSSHSLGFVNLKPILPGHVLVCPKRVIKRFTDLTEEEVGDLWLSAQAIGAILEGKYKTDALTLSMQDGLAAGQTVNHVHVHVIPRCPGDFKRNDEIYDKLDKHDASRIEDQRNAIPDDENRRPRTKQEMWDEAAELRQFIANSLE